MTDTIKKRILVVEDDAIIALTEARTIKEFGYDVVTAQSARQAIGIMDAGDQIDLVLMDIDLGRGMTGPELAGEILEKRDIPIVFLTSHQEREFVESVKKITRYGYVIKNSGDFVLRSSIEMAFELFEAHKTIKAKMEALAASKETVEKYLRNAAENEARLSLALDVGSAGIWEWNLADDTVSFDARFHVMLGYAPGDLPGKGDDWKTYHHPDDLPVMLARAEAYLRGEIPLYESEHRIRSKSGEWQWVFTRGRTVKRSADGGPEKFMGIAINITDRRQAEREQTALLHILNIFNEHQDLHEIMHAVTLFMRDFSQCEAVGIRLRSGHDFPYFETTGFPPEFVKLESSLCTTDLDGQLLRDDIGNPVLECMCGNIICGRFDPSKQFFTVNGSFWSNCTTDLLASATEADLQGRTRNRCNQMGYESVALVPLRAGKKTFGLLQLNDRRRGRFNAAVIGVLERLCASIAMGLSRQIIAAENEAREQSFHTMIDFTSDWEYWTAPDGALIYMSPSCQRITGYEPDEFMTDQGLLRSIVHPDDRAAYDRHYTEHLRQGIESGERMVDFRVVTKGGNIAWIGHRCRPVHDKTGKWLGVRASNRDITGRIRWEETLRDRESRYHRLLSSIMDYVYTVELKDGLPVRTVHGPGCEAVTGYLPENFQADPNLWYTIIYPEDRNAVVAYAGDVIAGRSRPYIEHRIINRNGSLRWVRNTPVPCYDDRRVMTSYDSVIMDITERKLAEEKISSLLAEKELLLKEVHHRIKNNMNTMMSLLQLQETTLKDPVAVVALENARGRMQSMSVLYDKLYRSENLREMPVSEYLYTLVDEIAGNCPNCDSVKIEKQIGDFRLGARALSSVGMIVNELISNSMKYAFSDAGGGLVRVEVSENDSHAKVVIEDNGKGIPPSVDIGTTSGLGLKLVGLLTQQLHGKIRIERERGTRFVLEFDIER